MFAGLALAHRLGTGGVLIARVLESSGKFTAFQTLGRILPDLEPATIEDLSRRLEALPPPEPASATIGPESRFVVGSLRAKLLAHGPMVAGEDWDEVGFSEEEAAVLKRLTGGDRAKLLAHLDTTGPAFAELARRLDLPRPEYRAALTEFAAAERSTQPVVAGLVAAAWGGRHMVDRIGALRSMFPAGLALVRGGEPAFRDRRSLRLGPIRPRTAREGLPDPFGDEGRRSTRGDARDRRRGLIGLTRHFRRTRCSGDGHALL